MKRVTAISPQLQQRINIFFCVKMGWTFEEIRAALQTVYPTNTLCDTSIHKWIREFRGGRETMVDKPRASKTRSGRSPANIRKIENLVAQDRRVTLKEMCVKSGIPTSTIQNFEEGLEVNQEMLNICPFSFDRWTQTTQA